MSYLYYMLQSLVRSLTVAVMLTLLLPFCKKREPETPPEISQEEAARRMQEFVIQIANYARQRQPNFVIIPQNGPELVFEEADPEKPLYEPYVNTISAQAVEELFYNGSLSPDPERLDILRQLKNRRKILVSEYVSADSNISDAYDRVYQEGFIAFVRDKDNYHYRKIPDTIPFRNGEPILSMDSARNFLYLINPELFSSREEMVQAISRTDYDVVVLDLFFRGEMLSAAEVSRLKTKPNGSRRLVLSYVNIGAAERFRYYWQEGWRIGNPSWIRKRYRGYEDEFWVAYWDPAWKEIIYDYIRRVIDAGFDGAYLDNVEAYYFLYND